MRSTLRTFYVLVFTQVFSMLGSAMTTFAVSVWVYTETGSTTPLLLTAFFYWLPRVLLSSFAGVLADRFSRKRLIVLGDAGQAVPTLLLALSFLSGHFAVWHLYAVAFVQALFALVQGPAIMASITLLVPDAQRPRANALIAIADPLAGLLAPALGGVLYTAVGVAGVIFIDLATFLAAVAVIARIDIPRPSVSADSAAARGSLWQEATLGIRFLRQRPGLLILVLYFTFLNLMTNGPLMLRTPYILERTGSEELLGVLLTLSTLGLVVGGLITVVWQGTRPRVHTIFPALIGGGVALMLFSLVRSPLALAVVGFVMQLPYKMSNAHVSAIWQAKVPPDMQGRVFAFGSQLALFALPFTYLLSGPLVDRFLEPAVDTSAWAPLAPLFGREPGAGIALYIFVSALIWLVGTVAVYALPAVRHLEGDLRDYGTESATADAPGQLLTEA